MNRLRSNLLALGALLVSAPAMAAPVTLKLGTLAPEGSVWHESLVTLTARFKELSKDKVEIKIFPNGVAGAEGDMMRKLRIGQLHAATVTGVALGEISKSAMALTVPMFYDSWEHLDCVRAEFGPVVEKDLADKGYVLLTWGDAGWVHQFAKTPGRTPDDFRKMKYFVWAGDPDSERAFRSAKFNVVPLASTDVMSALQTGMIDSFGTTPVFALASQWFGSAKHMLRLRWSPLNGGTIVTKKMWEKIDPAVRPELLRVSREEGQKLNLKIREMNDKSVTEMAGRGLQVIEPTAEDVAAWRAAAEMAYPVVREQVVGAEAFDAVKTLVAKCRPK